MRSSLNAGGRYYCYGWRNPRPRRFEKEAGRGGGAVIGGYAFATRPPIGGAGGSVVGRLAVAMSV